MSPSRTLICTFTALTSGAFGAYLGGQLSVSAQNRACETHFWGPKPVCKVVAAPGALWQGSLTGLGAGAILGAFFAGLATRKTAPNPALTIHSPDQGITEAKPTSTTAPPTVSESVTLAAPTALTSLQTEVLYCLLALLTAKQISSEAVETELATDEKTPDSANLPELRTWAKTMVRSHPDTYDVTKPPDLQAVTVEEARQLLIEAGFSVQAVDQAWQLLQAANSLPSLT
ncbi:MAG TPA: hypothetical protein V6D04_13305 [Candidatus Obscuribacterales bacterium]